MSLITDRGGASTQSVPLIGLAEAGAAGYFDDSGFPTAKGWDEIAFPAVNDEHVYALEVSGDAMQPAYRDGTVIVVSPSAPIRRGDRVVVKTRDGEVMVKELKRRTAKSIELRALSADQAERTLSVDEVRGSRASCGRVSSFYHPATSITPRTRYRMLTAKITRRVHCRNPTSVMRSSTIAASEVPAIESRIAGT